VNKDIIYSFSSILLTSSVGLLTTSYLSRNLSENDFGFFSSLFLILSMTMFLDGLRPIVVYSVARSDNKSLNSLLFLTILISVFGGLTSFFFLHLIFGGFSLLDRIFISISLALNLIISFFWGILEGNQIVGKSKFIRNFFFIFIYLLMVYSVFVGLDKSAFSLIILINISLLLIVFILMVFRKGYFFKIELNKMVLKPLLISSKYNLFFNALASITYMYDRSILSNFLGLESLAIYSSQYELSTRGNLLSSNLSNILFPYLSKLDSKDQAYVLWRNITSSVVLALFIICSLLSFFSHEIITIYLGEKYSEWHNIFKLLVVGLYLNSFSFFGVVYYRSQGNFKTYVYYYLISIILAISFSIIIISLGDFTIYGAVFIYLITRFSDLLIAFSTFAKKDILILVLLLLIPISLFVFHYFFSDNYYLIMDLIYIVFMIVLFKSKSMFNFKRV